MSKRKAYRPRQMSLNPMRVAINRAATLTKQERGMIMGEARPSFDRLREGRANRQDWCYLADAANVGEALSGIGICSDEASRKILMDMQLALKSIAERVNASKCWTARGPELSAILEGLDRHELQLQFCSLAELQRAVDITRKQIQAARDGRVDCVTIVEAA